MNAPKAPSMRAEPRRSVSNCCAMSLDHGIRSFLCPLICTLDFAQSIIRRSGAVVMSPSRSSSILSVHHWAFPLPVRGSSNPPKLRLDSAALEVTIKASQHPFMTKPGSPSDSALWVSRKRRLYTLFGDLGGSRRCRKLCGSRL